MKVYVNLWKVVKRDIYEGEIDRVRGKVWAKKVIDVDESKDNGYAFIGEFLPFRAYQEYLTTIDLEKDDIIIVAIDRGSHKYHTYEVSFCQVIDVKEDDIKLKIIHYVEGYDWAKQILIDKEFVNFLKNRKKSE
ncbi:MAG: hypothetical protein QXT38_04115 [Candidatus Aenigmatarchaeota archaeon]